MDDANASLACGLISKAYISQGQQALAARRKWVMLGCFVLLICCLGVSPQQHECGLGSAAVISTWLKPLWGGQA